MGSTAARAGDSPSPHAKAEATLDLNDRIFAKRTAEKPQTKRENSSNYSAILQRIRAEKAAAEWSGTSCVLELLSRHQHKGVVGLRAAAHRKSGPVLSHADWRHCRSVTDTDRA